MAANKARVYFGLAGYNFDPDIVTQALGIEPTSVDATGMRASIDKPAISSWELSSETVSGGEIDVYELTNELIKQIEPAKDKIKQIMESHNLSPRICAVLTLSCDQDTVAPDVGFGARTIRFLSEIGAFINVEYKLQDRG